MELATKLPAQPSPNHADDVFSVTLGEGVEGPSITAAGSGEELLYRFVGH
jgi:hypothetical protein